MALVTACGITVAVLGALFYHGGSPDALDKAVFSAVWPHRRGLAPLAPAVGPVPVGVATAVLCYCCLALRRYTGAIMLALAVPAASGSTELLKHLIHRIYLGFLSFPSGHTTATFALITCVVVLLVEPPARTTPRSMRVVLAVLSVGFGGLVALGLVAARWHYFTDTIGGAAMGIGVTLVVALALDLAAARRDRSNVAAAAPRKRPRAPRSGPAAPAEHG